MLPKLIWPSDYLFILVHESDNQKLCVQTQKAGWRAGAGNSAPSMLIYVFWLHRGDSYGDLVLHPIHLHQTPKEAEIAAVQPWSKQMGKFAIKD